VARKVEETELAGLKKRLDRERRARLEAERIAEKATRELYERQEALRQLADIVETAGDAILAIAPDSRIKSWNSGAQALYGYTAEEAVGQPLGILIPAERSKETRDVLRRILEGDTVEGYESEARRNDGHHVDVFLRVSPIKDTIGAIVGASLIARDITERKRAQAEADRLKEEFFGLVSHDLRTPLTSIKGYCELLLKGEAGELPKQSHQFLEVMARNIARLERLVADLLFAAQVEAGTFAIQAGTIDLAKVLTQCVEATSTLAEEKAIQLTLDADPIGGCPGDADRIAQLLENLLSNAIKYTPEGGRVEARLRRENGRALIEVQDSGIGISEEEQQHVFDRFFRASSEAAQAAPGVGLGLTIVKAIADAHRGHVRVKSSQGTGTTFRVELPLEAEHHQSEISL
jgi:PAS domain S-box-containing protein